MQAATLMRCGCSYEFPEYLGAWGCPNCEGEDGPAGDLPAVTATLLPPATRRPKYSRRRAATARKEIA